MCDAMVGTLSLHATSAALMSSIAASRRSSFRWARRSMETKGVDEKNAPQPKIASPSGERRNDEPVGGLV
jgi:hypothetical protein